MSPVTILCLAIFCLGLYGVLVRRDVLGILASIEVMLGSANILLVALSATAGPESPQVNAEAVALTVVVVAAAEAAVGLALLLTAARRSGKTRIDELTEVDG